MNQLLLAAKGIGILLVVIGHSLPGRGLADNPPFFRLLKDTIYLFHMPFFFFLSGWLYVTYSLANTSRYPSAGRFIWLKCQRLMAPYFILGTVGFLLKGAVAAQSYRPYEFSLRFLLHGFLHPMEGAVQMYWFLAALFCIFLCHPLLRFSLKQDHPASRGVLLATLFCLHMALPMDYTMANLSGVAHYFIYFFLGCLLGPWLAERDTLLSHPLSLAGLAAVFVLAAATSSPGSKLLLMAAALAGIGFTLAICSLLARHIPQRLAQVASYSLQIYLLSWFAQNPIRLLYQAGLLGYIPTFALMVIAGTWLPIHLARLLQRRSPSLAHLIGLG